MRTTSMTIPDDMSYRQYPKFSGFLYRCVLDAKEESSAKVAVTAELSLESSVEELVDIFKGDSSLSPSRSLSSLVSQTYPLLFREESDVRSGALLLLEHIFEIDKKSAPSSTASDLTIDETNKDVGHEEPTDDMSESLIDVQHVEPRIEWMRTRTQENKVEGLRAWFITIKALKLYLHNSKSTKLLNELLQIPEKAMKSSVNQVRREAFLAWIALIDNFGSRMSIISKKSRLNLLLKPFTASLKSSEACLSARLDGWLHLITTVDAMNVSESVNHVVSDFLTFVFDPKQIGKDGSTKSSKKIDVLKSFPALTDRLLQGLTVLIRIALNFNISNGSNDKCVGVLLREELRHQVLYAVQRLIFVFLKHPSNFECQAFKEMLIAFRKCYLEQHSKDDRNERKQPLEQEGEHQPERTIQEGQEQQQQQRSSSAKEDAVTFLLQVIRLIETHCDSGSSLHDVFTLFETLLSPLPSEILFSSTKNVVEKFVKLLLHRGLRQNAETEVENDQLCPLLTLLETVLVKVDLIPKIDALKFLNECINTLGTHAATYRLNSKVWLILSTTLLRLIDCHADINGSTCPIQCDISAVMNLLTYPFTSLGDVVCEERSILKKWHDVYEATLSSVALIPAYESLQLELSLIDVLIRVVAECKGPPERPQQVIIVSEVFAQCLSASFCGTDDLEATNASKYIELFQALVNRQASLSNERHLATEFHRNITTIAINLITNSRSQKNMQLLLRTVYKPLCSFLRSTESKVRAFKDDSIIKEIDLCTAKVLEKAVKLLQIHYNGPFDKALLNHVKTFMMLLLTNKNVSLKRSGQQLWLQSFNSNIDKKDIPSELADILKRNYCYTSDSHSSMNSNSGMEEDSVDDNSAMMLSTIAPSSTPSSFQGFLQAISPTKTKPMSKISPGVKSRKAPWGVKDQKRRLEEEDSQDFVAIESSSRMPSVLTEHQQEVLNRRRDDIPALYSELSVDDSQNIQLSSTVKRTPSEASSGAQSLDGGREHQDGSRRKSRTPVKNCMPLAVFGAKKACKIPVYLQSAKKNDEVKLSDGVDIGCEKRMDLNEAVAGSEEAKVDSIDTSRLSSSKKAKASALEPSLSVESTQSTESSLDDTGVVIVPSKVLLEPMDPEQVQSLLYKTGYVKSIKPLLLEFDSKNTEERNKSEVSINKDENCPNPGSKFLKQNCIGDSGEGLEVNQPIVKDKVRSEKIDKSKKVVNKESNVDKIQKRDVSKEDRNESRHHHPEGQEDNQNGLVPTDNTVCKDNSEITRSTNEGNDEAEDSKLKSNSTFSKDSKEIQDTTFKKSKEEGLMISKAYEPLCLHRERRRRRLSRKVQESLQIGGKMSQELIAISLEDNHEGQSLAKAKQEARQNKETDGLKRSPRNCKTSEKTTPSKLSSPKKDARQGAEQDKVRSINIDESVLNETTSHSGAESNGLSKDDGENEALSDASIDVLQSNCIIPEAPSTVTSTTSASSTVVTTGSPSSSVANSSTPTVVTSPSSPTSACPNTNEDLDVVSQPNLSTTILAPKSSASTALSKMVLKQGSVGHRGVKRKIGITSSPLPLPKRSAYPLKGPQKEAETSFKAMVYEHKGSSKSDVDLPERGDHKSNERKEDDNNSMVIDDSQDTIDEIGSSQEVNQGALQSTIGQTSKNTPEQKISCEEEEKKGSDSTAFNQGVESKAINSKSRNAIMGNRASGKSPLPQNRAAAMLLLSHTKLSSTTSSSPFPPSKSSPSSSKLLRTPTSKSRPWQRYTPSPSDASPPSSILKVDGSDSKTKNNKECEGKVAYSCSEWTRQRRRSSRRVQFSDPPVSERVEVPRHSQTHLPVNAPKRNVNEGTQKNLEKSEETSDKPSSAVMSSSEDSTAKCPEDRLDVTVKPKKTLQLITEPSNESLIEAPIQAVETGNTEIVTATPHTETANVVQVQLQTEIPETSEGIVETSKSEVKKPVTPKTSEEPMDIEVESNSSRQEKTHNSDQRTETREAEVDGRNNILGYEGKTIGCVKDTQNYISDRLTTDKKARGVTAESKVNPSEKSNETLARCYEESKMVTEFCSTQSSDICSQMSNGSYVATPPFEVYSLSSRNAREVVKEVSKGRNGAEFHGDKVLSLERDVDETLKINDVVGSRGVGEENDELEFQQGNKCYREKSVQTSGEISDLQSKSSNHQACQISTLPSFAEIEATLESLEHEELFAVVNRCMRIIESKVIKNSNTAQI